MIIETDEYRQLLTQELAMFDLAEETAKMNKRYGVKCATIVAQSTHIVCGNFSSFTISSYTSNANFHPEVTVLDCYSADLDVEYYVAKLNLAGESQPSRPCARCMKEIKDSGEVKFIYYRDKDLRIIKEEL